MKSREVERMGIRERRRLEIDEEIDEEIHHLFSFYNGLVAQSVEQWTENPCVGGSIPSQATIF